MFLDKHNLLRFLIIIQSTVQPAYNGHSVAEEIDPEVAAIGRWPLYPGSILTYIKYMSV